MPTIVCSVISTHLTNDMPKIKAGKVLMDYSRISKGECMRSKPTEQDPMASGYTCMFLYYRFVTTSEGSQCKQLLGSSLSERPPVSTCNGLGYRATGIRPGYLSRMQGLGQVFRLCGGP